MGHGCVSYARRLSPETLSQCGLGVSPSRSTGVSVAIFEARASPEGRGVDSSQTDQRWDSSPFSLINFFTICFEKHLEQQCLKKN